MSFLKIINRSKFIIVVKAPNHKEVIVCVTFSVCPCAEPFPGIPEPPGSPDHSKGNESYDNHRCSHRNFPLGASPQSVHARRKNISRKYPRHQQSLIERPPNTKSQSGYQEKDRQRSAPTTLFLHDQKLRDTRDKEGQSHSSNGQLHRVK